VALVVSESEARVFGEPFFAGIIRGISSFLLATPLQLWLAMAHSPQERERVDQYLTPQHVDGVMLLSLHDDDTLPVRLRERELPAVLGGRPAGMLAPGAVPVSYVDVDNVGGAGLAVSHLAGQGRRQIAVIASSQDMAVGVDRLTGYRESIVRAGLTPDEMLIGYGDFSEESGAAAMRTLLAARPGIDAVFATSDLMAVGAMRVLKETGRKIPADVAVVGFENSVLAKQTDPPLTTVHQPVEEMGREMARLLVDLIKGQAQPNATVTLDTHLVRRSSA
jgi:DNA-binding LacI/PurR family transcriptional regulator